MNHHPFRILALVPYKIFPAIMGGQKGIALFYKYLSDVVKLTCLTTKKNVPSEKYEVLNELSNASFRYANPFIFFKVLSLLKKKQCTHLLVEHPYFAWLIVGIRCFTNKHIIVHSHNIECERFKSIGKWWWKLLWYYERTAYKMAHQVWFKTNEDLQYAIKHFGLSGNKCHVIPYGIEAEHLPNENDLIDAKKEVRRLHHISDQEIIFLFNGTLSYKPNLDAVLAILHQINPLIASLNLKYKILICGNGLPAELEELKAYKNHHIIYCGFVDDIDLYFKACDIFLNPLIDGGGIKTKLVEALGFGQACISSVNGAIGVNASCTGGRLKIVGDLAWTDYLPAINAILANPIKDNNQAFYEHYSWKKIALKAFDYLNRV